MQLLGRWRILFALTLLGLFSLSVLWEKTFELGIVKIGVLAVSESRLSRLEGLKAGLKDLGYSEDNLQFLVYEAGGREARLPWMGEMMLEDEPDILVTLGTIETLILKERMEFLAKNIPTVFIGVAAPKELGLIEDYQKPGGVFTGVHHPAVELSAKRLEILTELIPGLERVAVLYSSNLEVSRQSMELVLLTAKQFGIVPVVYDFQDPGIIRRLEKDLIEVDAILPLPGYPMETWAPEIATLALKRGLPVMGIYDQEAAMGYLFSYGPSAFGLGYQGARHVSALLKGVSPSLVPVEYPDNIELMVNPDTKERLKLELEAPLARMAREASLLASGWLSVERYD